ncbi:MAG: hypothetical protein IT303_19040 [Dehalococcoidia bacterium]|nr:hypothetical protein [Dehalococcoidia bacterium]
MYRRLFSGIIDQGNTRTFIEAMREARDHQTDRGIRARTSIWGAMTGQTNGMVIVSDFETLDDLERFTEMAAEDASFATMRRAVASQLVFDASDVSIHRLSYHSEGLYSSEDATAPRRYMRVLSGEVQAGRHREFVMAISQALEFQKQRGIDATTSVWSAVTGHTSGVSVVAEFDTLAELERFDELAQKDAEFAELRKASRASMVFLTSDVALYRNLA